MATTQDLANSIAAMEGVNVAGSLAQRNNNPGNIRYVGQVGATQGDGGFAKFPSMQAGWDALLALIDKRSGQGMTLTSFLNSYAPPSENDTNNYIGYVSGKTGVSPDTPLSVGFTKG